MADLAIPSEFIDDLVARTDLVDLVSDYVSLSAKGGRYWGLCPFHGEKTASFSVQPDQQLYYCFGCGKGGGVVSFAMEAENLPFLDAIRFLSKRAGVEFPEENDDPDRRQRRARLLALNKEAARWFHKQLHGPAGREGLEYLRRRGLSNATMTRFGLGYAPESWDGLIRAMDELGYHKGDLIEAGLAVGGQKGSIYDRFRNRVMFPIIDLRGDVIGFGGRVMGEGTPKYLNSPDTPVFNKSRNLFALNLAKGTKGGRIILTEGYMDTISLHQAGFDGAVASLGTALTPDHAKLISRFTQEVVICYDSDEAGTRAANRAIPLLEKTGLKVRVLKVTGAKDPDEFIKSFGREAFYRLLEQSENHIEYNLHQLESQYNLEDPAGRVEFAHAAAELIARMDSPVEREVYAGRAAQTAQIGVDSILQEVKRVRAANYRSARKKQERKDLTPVSQAQPRERKLRYENPRSALAEEGILRLLMLDGTMLKQTEGLEPEQFSSPALGRIYGVLQNRIREGRPTQLGMLESELDREEVNLLADILRQPASLENAIKAMGDYRAVIETERRKKATRNDEAALLAAWEDIRKKRIGDGTP